MKELYRVVIIVGLLSMLFFESCTDESNSPTEPSSESPSDTEIIVNESTPTPTPRPVSDVVIIVDKNHANAVTAPCGTEDAVCQSITDGIFSATMYQDGVPTVLVRPGIYDQEPTYPIQVRVPVILKAERAHEAIIASALDGALTIAASDVMVEGITILSHAWYASGIIAVSTGGHVTLSNVRLEIDVEPESTCVRSVAVDKGAIAIIEFSELHSMIRSHGSLIMNDSILSQAYNCPEGLVIHGGLAVVNNNTLYDLYVSDGATAIEFKRNMVSKRSEIYIKQAILEGNTFAEGLQVSGGTLNDNLINNGLSLGMTAFLSRNRFDSKVDGITLLECPEEATIQTDETNRLLNPNCWIACDGLPLAPGSDPF
jgi:hypothetical protein